MKLNISPSEEYISQVALDLDRDRSSANDANNKTSILVVDDEPDIVRFIEQSLQRNGIKVSGFIDTAMALDDFKINCKTCCLILSDIRMPGMSGYELIRKAKEIDKQVKVVLMSAFEIEDKEFHNVLPDIKVDGFLQKPFSIRALIDIVQKWCVITVM